MYSQFGLLIIIRHATLKPYLVENICKLDLNTTCTTFSVCVMYVKGLQLAFLKSFTLILTDIYRYIYEESFGEF